MIDEHDTTRIFDDVLFTAKTKFDSDDLRCSYHTSGWHSKRFHVYISFFKLKGSILFTCVRTYSAFFQLPIRNSMNGIHNPADSALATMKKMNFARYLTFSLKAQTITKRNIRAMPLVV